MSAQWKCIECEAAYPLDQVRYTCDCGGLLDVVHDLPALRGLALLEMFDRRLAATQPADLSGVWRYRELILPVPKNALVSRPEGNTPLYRSPRLARWIGLDDVAF